MSQDNGKYRLMFYYVGNAQIAREIMSTHLLPLEEDLDPRFLGSYVTLTDIKPEEGTSEEGRRRIAKATGMPANTINHALEVVVESSKVRAAVEPHSYWIVSDEPVSVKVVRDYDMGTLGRRQARGRTIERRINRGFPHARLVATGAR